jgi:hypothetical protein
MFVVGLCDFFAKPPLDRRIASRKRAKAIPDNFAFRRVFARGDFGSHHLCHVMGQRNGQGLVDLISITPLASIMVYDLVIPS